MNKRAEILNILNKVVRPEFPNNELMWNLDKKEGYIYLTILNSGHLEDMSICYDDENGFFMDFWIYGDKIEIKYIHIIKNLPNKWKIFIENRINPCCLYQLKTRKAIIDTISDTIIDYHDNELAKLINQVDGARRL